MIVTILVFLLVLTVLVLIHELGHFLVAKKLGIKVEEFGFGLPPRIIGKKIGETVYSINWLPIGGFVKLFGEDEAGGGRIGKIVNFKNPSGMKKAFFSRPWWEKGSVIVAGVVMNFLLAVFILSFLSAAVGTQIPDKVFVENVTKGSPAEMAGLKKDDQIESINNVKITDTQQLLEETKKNLGHRTVLKIQSEGVEKEISITPRVNYPKDQGPMGVVIRQNFEVKKYSWFEAPVVGFKEALNQTSMLLRAGAVLIGQIFSGAKVPEGTFAGPVGIAQLTGILCQNPYVCLSFMSGLSLNLAIINVLPIPALDGGRLFFILIEAITRRKVHPKFESYAHTVGMALLLGLIVLITIHDLTRILSGQPILPKQ